MKIDGKPVKNAQRKLIVNITDEDITRALRSRGARNPGKCAAAQALMREGVCPQARVHLDRTYLDKGDHWERYRTPISLRNEIVAIDRGGRFEPGDHELKLLNPAAMRDTDRGVRQGSAKGDDKDAARKRKLRRKLGPKRTNHLLTGVREAAKYR